MPLIVMCGLPCSGKTSRSIKLKEQFNAKGINVIIISEDEVISKRGLSKNEYFTDLKYEKMGRADIKSEVMKSITNEDLVILDAGNYIKGYRYEIYCACKEQRQNLATVFCAVPKDQAWQFNQIKNVYKQEIFEALCLRFEEPSGNNRWDSPLFITFPEDDLNVSELFTHLFENKPINPNRSTQCAPLNSANYLFELDKKTQEVINQIISVRKLGAAGPITIYKELKIEVPQRISTSELNRLRRQFLNLTKIHNGTSLSQLDQVTLLFVQFLNSNLNA